MAGTNFAYSRPGRYTSSCRRHQHPNNWLGQDYRKEGMPTTQSGESLCCLQLDYCYWLIVGSQAVQRQFHNVYQSTKYLVRTLLSKCRPTDSTACMQATRCPLRTARTVQQLAQAQVALTSCRTPAMTQAQLYKGTCRHSRTSTLVKAI